MDTAYETETKKEIKNEQILHQGYLSNFGFQVYRLRKAKPEGEILVYNTHRNKYDCYSLKRAEQIILKELNENLKEKNLSIEEFLHNIYNTDKQINVKKVISNWVEHELILIDDLRFRPIEDKLFQIRGNKYFNSFNTPETLKHINHQTPISFEEFKEKATAIYSLFNNLHNNDDVAIQNTLLKIADKIKYPYEKAQDCIVFYPAEAAGKGIFYKYIIQPIFEDYCRKVLMKKLNSDFNAFLRECLVLVLEEGKRDLELVETLKEVVTEGTILINEKGKNQQEEEIYFLTFVFSNNMNPIDLGKRRGSYHYCQSLGRNVQESQKKGRELCEKIPEEIPFLLNYLHNLEFEHQEAMEPFNTIAKNQVNDLNKNPLELFYDYLCTYGNLNQAMTNLNKKRYVAEDRFDTGIQELKGEIYVSKDIIKDAYNNFCHNEGLKSNIIKHNKDIVQLWVLLEIPVESHKRILITDPTSINLGRKLDHVRLKDINEHLKQKYEELKE